MSEFADILKKVAFEHCLSHFAQTQTWMQNRIIVKQKRSACPLFCVGSKQSYCNCMLTKWAVDYKMEGVGGYILFMALHMEHNLVSMEGGGAAI